MPGVCGSSSNRKVSDASDCSPAAALPAAQNRSCSLEASVSRACNKAVDYSPSACGCILQNGLQSHSDSHRRLHFGQKPPLLSCRSIKPGKSYGFVLRLHRAVARRPVQRGQENTATETLRATAQHTQQFAPSPQMHPNMRQQFARSVDSRQS